MANFNYTTTYRWSESDIRRFYDSARMSRFRRRAVAATALGLLIGTLIWPYAFVWLLVAAVLGAALLDYALKSPIRKRSEYEELCARWRHLLEASNPETQYSANVKLHDGESVIYARPSARYVDQTSANGAAAPTCIDRGDLIVTDQRIIFLGAKNTLSVDRHQIMRYTLSYDGRHIRFEYPQRPAGESFEVESPLFSLCMNRRGGLSEFSTDPLPPLPLDGDYGS